MTVPDRPLVALAVICGSQGAVLVGYAVYDLVELVRIGITGPAEVSNPAAMTLLIAITALFGVALVWVATGWWRGRRWARAPFVLAQLIGGFIGFELTGADGAAERFIGIAIVVVALLGLALAFAPAVNRRLVD